MTPQGRLATREFFGVKLGLVTIRTLVDALGHPERTGTPVIIAGTNGKGSVTAMVSHALHAAGLRVGRYTSPHLVHLRERFVIDGTPVTDEALDAALQEVFDAEDALLSRSALPGPATYFELTTATAFVLFRAAAVDVAVLEVGLGGRLDATNVVDAPFAAITSIGFDHMVYLGDSLAQIAAEKAGVIATGATVVSGVTDEEPARVIAETCTQRRATLIRAEDDVRIGRTDSPALTLETPLRTYGPLVLGLHGAHQVANASVAVRLLEALEAAGIGGGRDAIVAGLTQARWPGRLDRRTLPSGVPIVLDGAHNPDGARALAAWLQATAFTPVTLVTACMRDKDIDGLLAPLLPLASRVIATTVDLPRSLPADALASRIATLAPGLRVEAAATPADALRTASSGSARVVVAGSLFLVGAALAWLDEAPGPSDPA